MLRRRWKLDRLHLYVLVIVTASYIQAWHNCSNNREQSTCPDGNKCCHYSNDYHCLSGKNETQGACCDGMGKTGCGDGFRCAWNEIYGDYCSRINKNDDMLPETLPRYRLCSLPSHSLQSVYSLKILETSSIAYKSVMSKGGSIAAAYLSSMGALDTSYAALLAAQGKVDTVLIAVHGSSRNPDDYLCCAYEAAANTSTMILAPWFLAPTDKIENMIERPPEPLRWIENGPIPHTWRYGADSIQHNVSSYAVLDEMIHQILADRERFHSLRRIVVVGHSAGGQYVQRWALLSNGSAFAKPDQSYVPRVPIRVVVANPKSFCWMDTRRIFPDGKLRLPKDDAIYLCPTYNEWEWGFDNSTRSTEREKLESSYKDEAIRVAGGIDVVVARYPSRDIVYLAGERDVLWNGDCEAKMQGRFRRERSENFFASLQQIYGGEQQVHERLVVHGVGHDHCLMFQSSEGKKALFGSFEEALPDIQVKSVN